MGNVRAVVSDVKVPEVDGSGNITNLTADVVSATDYYPFGMQMPGRSFSSNAYRYGFQGQEKDDEIKGSGNHIDFGARGYDPRIGRWWKVDPKFKLQPGWSPYKGFLDNPIIYEDPDGGTEYLTIIMTDTKTGKSRKITKIISNDVFPGANEHGAIVDGWGGHGDRRNYYDRETTITLNITDNEVEFSRSSRLVRENGVQARNVGLTATSDNWANAKVNVLDFMSGLFGEGGLQESGYYLTSKDGGDLATKQQAVFDPEMIKDADLLFSAVGGLASKASNNYERFKNIGDGISKVNDLIDLAKKEGFLKTQNTDGPVYCRTCGGDNFIRKDGETTYERDKSGKPAIDSVDYH